MEETIDVQNWSTLPYEVKMMVLVKARTPDLLRFCTTSKKGAEICNDDYFWFLKTQRDFSNRFPEVRKGILEHTRRWKEEYKYYLEKLGGQLLKAAEEGDRKEVEELVDFGVDINAKDWKGWTALIYASRLGYADMVRMLLYEGAEVNVKGNNGFTALLYAPHGGDIDIARMLLEKGADINAKTIGGYTALMNASQAGQVDMVRMLLDEGADVNVKTGYGFTALIYASQRGDSDIGIVRMLLDEGADVNVQDITGSTALNYALILRRRNIARMLKEAGAK